MPTALEGDGRPAWFGSAIDELTAASVDPIVIVEPDNFVTRLQRRCNLAPPTTSRRRQVQREIRDRVLDDLPSDLPAALRHGVRDWVPIDDAVSSQQWCDQLAGITQLILNSRTVIQVVASAEPRLLTRA